MKISLRLKHLHAGSRKSGSVRVAVGFKGRCGGGEGLVGRRKNVEEQWHDVEESKDPNHATSSSVRVYTLVAPFESL